MSLSVLLNHLPSCGSDCKRGVQFLQLFLYTVQVVWVVVTVLLANDAAVVVACSVVRMAFAE